VAIDRIERILIVASTCCFLAAPPKPLAAQAGEDALAEQISAKLASGRIDEAIAEARRAVAAHHRSAALYQLLGAALFKKGAHEEARAAFRRSTELDPAIAENYFNLALVDLAENRLPDAAKWLEEFLRREPAHAQARVLLGRAYHNLNQTEPAIEQFRKALELSPALPLAHYHLGYAYQSQGRRTEALEEFRKEIELNPNFYDAYWLAGNIELGRGRLDSAEEFFRRGVRLRPQAFPARYGLARVLIERQQWAEAEAELKRVVAAKPDHVEAHYTLARVYQQTGRKEDAERQFKIVAELHRRADQRTGIAGNP
jgi:tetratricopeptide (TPR) repeat protein